VLRRERDQADARTRAAERKLKTAGVAAAPGLLQPEAAGGVGAGGAQKSEQPAEAKADDKEATAAAGSGPGYES